MTRHGLLSPGAAQGHAWDPQDTRRRRTGPAHKDPVAAGGAAAPGPGDPGGAEQARLRRKAGVHGQIAHRISGLMQGNAARCDDLRRRLAVLRVPGGPPSAARAAAVVEQEIQALERIIAWQAGTAGWHLGEARRLRDLAGGQRGPEGPAAAPAPGRTISGETTRQPGGCGQAEGA
jgi:hypothetical protein